MSDATREPTTAERLDAFVRSYLEVFASRDFSGTDAGDADADNRLVQAVILFLAESPSNPWRVALRKLRAEHEFRPFQNAGAVVERMAQIVIAEARSGTALAEVSLAAETIFRGASTLLSLWHEKAPAEAAPRPASDEARRGLIEGVLLPAWVETLRLTATPVAYPFNTRDTAEVGLTFLEGRFSRPGADAATASAAAGSSAAVPSREADGPSTPLDLGIDAWAYEAHAIATAAQAPVGDFRLWNPLDSRTGPICRPIAGLLVPGPVVSEILALRRRNPLAGRGFGSPVIAGRLTRLPPFHPLCRTYLVPAAYYAAAVG